MRVFDWGLLLLTSFHSANASLRQQQQRPLHRDAEVRNVAIIGTSCFALCCYARGFPRPRLRAISRGAFPGDACERGNKLTRSFQEPELLVLLQRTTSLDTLPKKISPLISRFSKRATASAAAR